MWKDKEAHFGGDYFFKDEAAGETAKVSGIFNLGQTLGGMRIRGWFTEASAGVGGKTITVKVEGANAVDAAEWTVLDNKTVTLVAEKRDFYSYIPDSDMKYCRVTVTGGAGLSGKFNVAPELIP
jgi:hypothetical protein